MREEVIYVNYCDDIVFWDKIPLEDWYRIFSDNYDTNIILLPEFTDGDIRCISRRTISLFLRINTGDNIFSKMTPEPYNFYVRE